MNLAETQKRFLKGLAHTMKPVVLVGQAGVTDALLRELDGALEHHELLKVKVRAGDRESRDAMIEAMTEASGSTLVQRIGNVAVLYRPNPNNKKPLNLPPA